MKRRHLPRSLVALLVAQLLLSVAPGGLNLCIAADGHAAVEFSHDDEPCLQDAQRHHPEEAAVAPRELERHPCRDVPLLETDPYRTPDPAPLVSARPIVCTALPESLSSLRRRSPPRCALVPLPAERIARALRTVVLVI